MFKKFCFFLFLIIVGLEGKVYDCFPFFNEYEILEIRLRELYDYVDRFVIVESCEGHNGRPKPYNLEKEWARYAPFADKIIYIKLEAIWAPCAWDRENWQKNQVVRGLADCSPSDLILFSDVDEIPNHELISVLDEALNTEPIVVVRHDMYRHFLNRSTDRPGWETGKWLGTIAMRGALIARPELGKDKWMPNHLRTNILFDGRWKEIFPDKEDLLKVDGGWHFTSMGGFERFREKCLSWTHYTNPSPATREHWRAEVEGHPMVPIGGSHPQYVRDHIDYFISVGLIDVQNGEIK